MSTTLTSQIVASRRLAPDRDGVLFERPHLAGPAGRGTLEVAAASERALARWEQEAPVADPPAEAGREAQMDHQRAWQTHLAERSAIQARRNALVGGPPAPRPLTVVIAHRHDWLRARLAELLTDTGMQVAVACDNAIDTVAAVITDQPDLLVLSDRIKGAYCPELVERLQRLCPSAVLAVQVEADADAEHFVGSGVSAIYARRTTPLALLDALGRLLA